MENCDYSLEEVKSYNQGFIDALEFAIENIKRLEQKIENLKKKPDTDHIQWEKVKGV